MQKISKGIVIRCYDVETNNLLSEETYPGLEGDYYKVEPKIIEGYEIITDNLPTNA